MTNAVKDCLEDLISWGLVNKLNKGGVALALRKMEANVMGQNEVEKLGQRNLDRIQKKRHTEKTKNQISNTLKTNFDLERVNNKLNKRI